MIDEFQSLMLIDNNNLLRKEVREDATEIEIFFVQGVNSIEVENSGVGMSFLKEPRGIVKKDMVSIGGQYCPDIDVSPPPKLSAEDAVVIGQRQLKSKQYLEEIGPLTEHDKVLSKPPILTIYPKSAVIKHTGAVQGPPGLFAHLRPTRCYTGISLASPPLRRWSGWDHAIFNMSS